MLESYKHFRAMTNENQKLYQLTDQDLQDIQQCLLGILQDIDQYCADHQITYLACGGTCLGTVRHQGFIPWDDDVDICMPRKDYEKFIAGFTEAFGDQYWVQNLKRDAKYDLNFSKVRKKGTVFEELFETEPEKAGLFIDIYPLENAFDNSVLRKLHGVLIDGLLGISSCVRMHSKWQKICWYTEEYEELQKGLQMKNILGTVLGIIPLRWWLLATEHVSEWCHNTQSKYVMIPSGRKHTFGEMCDRVHYFPTKRMPFAQLQISVQNHPEEHLKRLYGTDFMRIPTKKERVRHSVLRYALSLEGAKRETEWRDYDRSE
ncbi:MAG: LicD family protein [Lachnospiraceae bacterium]|nr:LicD family protein [Lachnospiraceae bacterium]